MSERCIDTDSLFAFGHSSGAQFIVQMLGDNRTRETRFAGVVPVASSRFNNPPWTPLPTLVIHRLDHGWPCFANEQIFRFFESPS